MTLSAAAETRVALRQRSPRRAPRNLVRSAELGPRREGARSSLCGSASAALLLSPPRHGGRSEFSHPKPTESNSLVWRVAEVAEEEAGASRCRRGRGAGSPERSSRLPPERPLQPRGPRVRGCPAAFRKSS
ncbi:PREDICTED: beta-1,3-galactosyl-O-glycosyl-glycoprotein beta-1,6-N-acetylglucosaminyltransferase 4 isoform X3 [Hipposideros armiger]|uniref:Beta-1,3-galactosyl-O-glycosyl-glycoprotein beta-1,6-N-acetylglucosaminyltransferase 4 isoform X3 n=1 Tax=Hipposideros armiger TaxID=186990 RepID=A0A8B7R6H3_HIPAR|nr:PREDICTED: beta-1,3-galactosyl-O-glycosyl-glycoprotein beta-1,6-N-acetylglucosaminyltransferase 4 isoform X3 [Hipposideros armiger]